MRSRRTLALLVGAASLAAVVLRRRAGSRREYVDLYHADGTKETLTEGADYERLMPLAREALRASA